MGKNWQSTSTLQDKKSNQMCGEAFATIVHLENTQQLHGTTCFTKNDNKYNFPSELNLDMHNLWYLCADLCDMPWTEKYLGQTTNKISIRWSSLNTNWNISDCEYDNRHMVL